MTAQLFRLALILGLVSAVGPFAIDMYLPALPHIAGELSVSETEAQATISVYFLIFGIAQLVYGPLADAVGRRTPMMIGIGIFFVATVAAAFAPTLGALVAARAVQAAGAAAVMVVPRAIIRDLTTGPVATRMMSSIMIVISISPMLAPLAGSGVMMIATWRWIFGALALAALVSLALIAFVLPETLEPQRRRPVRLAEMLTGARILMTDSRFLGLTFVGAFGMSSFFVFLAMATFVYTQQFGLSEVGFSLAFAANAISFFTASQFAGPLGARIGMERTVALAITGFCAVVLVLLVAVLTFGASLPLIMAGLFVANGFLGLVMPTTSVMALDPHPQIAGLASSLGGTLQLLTGAAMIGITGAIFGTSAVSMVASIAFCAVVAFAVAVATLPRLRLGVAGI